ncbi:hypothetical protein TB1_022251 [Malus domestica]
MVSFYSSIVASLDKFGNVLLWVALSVILFELRWLIPCYHPQSINTPGAWLGIQLSVLRSTPVLCPDGIRDHALELLNGKRAHRSNFRLRLLSFFYFLYVRLLFLARLLVPLILLQVGVGFLFMLRLQPIHESGNLHVFSSTVFVSFAIASFI